MLAGITQQQIGKTLGVSFQQVQKYENGTNRISAGRLYILARALGVEVEDFFDGIPNGQSEKVAAVDEDLQRVEKFIQTREGLRLNLGYIATTNRAIRNCILDLLLLK